MRIASWNINGIKARLDSLKRWLAEDAPDVVCLQEIKSLDENFPREEIERLGYNIETHGQKGFNGVALLSKRPLEDVVCRLPGGEGDVHCRFMEATVSGENGGSVRIASIYLPNGNPIDSEKFAYKLAWMDRLIVQAERLLAAEEPVVLAGDYNVIPQPEDVRFPERWSDDALFQPESRRRYRQLVNLGYTDAVRAVSGDPHVFTFWDYQAGAFQKDNGIRIDHLLLSPQAADRLETVSIEKRTRAWSKPSDHVPVVAQLAI